MRTNALSDSFFVSAYWICLCTLMVSPCMFWSRWYRAKGEEGGSLPITFDTHLRPCKPPGGTQPDTRLRTACHVKPFFEPLPLIRKVSRDGSFSVRLGIKVHACPTPTYTTSSFDALSLFFVVRLGINGTHSPPERNWRGVLKPCLVLGKTREDVEKYSDAQGALKQAMCSLSVSIDQVRACCCLSPHLRVCNAVSLFGKRGRTRDERKYVVQERGGPVLGTRGNRILFSQPEYGIGSGLGIWQTPFKTRLGAVLSR